MLCLSSETPLAYGLEKLVFQHPNDKQMLIKVWHQDYFDRIKKENPILTRLRRLPRYAGVLKELTEHLVARECGENCQYLQEITGLVDTDLGVGLVVKAVTRKNGELAKTLQEILSDEVFDDKHQKALEDLFEWLCSTNLIIRNLTKTNLVWDEFEESYVIIDGLGGRARFSLRQISPRYNNRSNIKYAKKLRSRIDSHFQNKIN